MRITFFHSDVRTIRLRFNFSLAGLFHLDKVLGFRELERHYEWSAKFLILARAVISFCLIFLLFFSFRKQKLLNYNLIKENNLRRL